MQIVLADIEQDALASAQAELVGAGADVLAMRTDVSKPASIEDLAKRTLERFGAVHLLFNNAGVGRGTGVSVSTLADWEWVLGANLWSVIHGVRVFVPLMQAQDSEAHIVNTASIAGLITGGLGIYTVSKHAVVALSETLYGELAEQKSKIGVSVLCPGWTRTRILDSERNRPPKCKIRRNRPLLPKVPNAPRSTPVDRGWPLPEHVADLTFEAIRGNKFYILTHPDMKPAIRRRMDNILEERNPSP